MGAGGIKTPPRRPARGVDVSSSAQGEAIAVVYGRTKVPVRILWVGRLHHVALERIAYESPGAGFGAATPQSDEFYYWISIQLALGEGPIEGVRTLYKRDTLFVLKDFNTGAVNGVITPPNLPGAKVFLGTAGQPAWTDDFEHQVKNKRWQSEPPEPALNLPHLAYLARHDWPLYQQAQLPNLSCELFGLFLDPTLVELDTRPNPPKTPNLLDLHPDPTPPAPIWLKIGANPADIVLDLLTNPVHGIGFPPEMLDEVSLADYRLACFAHGILLSLQCGEQKAGREWLTSILEQSNATVRFSGGKLQVLPLWDSVTTGPHWAPPHLRQTHVPQFLQKQPDGSYALKPVV